MPRRIRRMRQSPHAGVRRFIFIAELTILAVIAAGFFILGGIILWASVIPIPSINNFGSRAVSQSTKIYDRTGTIVLYDVNGSVRRTSVPLASINPWIRQASISIEDRTFYENVGFKPLSILRAILVNITSGGYTQGASTITQQVVKNALLTQSKTITRKIEEIILSVRLTRVYTKDEILNTYLNESPYGGTIYGVEEAAQYFFGVSAKDVDLAQAAYLAALPQAPTYYSPNGNHRDALDARKNLVLEKMKEQGYITDAQYQQATKETVTFKSAGASGIKAPHFVFYIQEYLESKYGVDAVMSGGLRVTTTLDYDLQQKVESVVQKYSPGMQKDFNASNTGTVVVDPKTGQILAMMGSKDYFNNSIDGQVNTTLAERQPGSSFKPFVYATAFEKGYTPETVVFDVQTQFSTSCSPSDITNDTPPCYSPGNYDGSYKGPMTLRNALAQSENIPAVKTLYLTGISDSIATAKSLGITSLGDPGQYGLTLVLGGGEVSLLEMTGAYGVFANDGVRNPSTGILEVQDNAGNILESYQSVPTRVIDSQITREISDVLSDNVARIPEFGVDSPLNFKDADVADKTGTTNDSRDAWIIGYTDSAVVGTWAGNNNNTPMVKKIAAFIVAPMWHDIMEAVIQKYPSVAFPKPAPEADPASLPPALVGNWNPNPSQGVHDILFWVQKSNPRGPAPTNPWADGQAAYWDYGVQAWLAANGGVGVSPQFNIPGGTGDGSSIISPSSEAFQITSPTSGAVISSQYPLTILASGGAGTVTRVTYSINGATVGSADKPPYAVIVNLLKKGPATLTAAIQTATGLQTQTVNFSVQ
ncbi:MAG: putative penicillin-binding protein [Candidatus Kaiserbacteria bacterium]|nr:putative penicillin-binding protein [Candidatus Kaiserbacteria bacterium]